MRIDVDDEERRITFLYKLEDGVAEGSFGMHCASMCGIPKRVIDSAEIAAKQWEHTSRLKESLERRRGGGGSGSGSNGGGLVGLGWWSDVAWILRESPTENRAESGAVDERGLEVLCRALEAL